MVDGFDSLRSLCIWYTRQAEPMRPTAIQTEKTKMRPMANYFLGLENVLNRNPNKARQAVATSPKENRTALLTPNCMIPAKMMPPNTSLERSRQYLPASL